MSITIDSYNNNQKEFCAYLIMLLILIYKYQKHNLTQCILFWHSLLAITFKTVPLPSDLFHAFIVPNLRSILMLRRQMDEAMRTSELGRLLTSFEVIEIELEILYDIVMEERFEPNGELFMI